MSSPFGRQPLRSYNGDNSQQPEIMQGRVITPMKRSTPQRQEPSDPKEAMVEVAETQHIRLKELLLYHMVQLKKLQDKQDEDQQKLTTLFEEQNNILEHSVQFFNQFTHQYNEFNEEVSKAMDRNQQLLLRDEEQFTRLKQQQLTAARYTEMLVKAEENHRIKKDQLQQKQMRREQQQQIKLQLTSILEEESQQLAQKKRYVSQLQTETKLFVQQQRVLNNELQEIKGNIRVYCRIRPLIHGEDESLSCVSTNGECSIQLAVPKNYHKSDNFSKNYTFNFEHIFDQDAAQNQIYAELSQLIENVIDGHNVCIFAYGQTGSGKTFTMQGLDTFEKRGVIPRAVEHIFQETKNLADLGWTFKMRVGFQEIYNETIRDLLSNQKTEEIQMADVADQSMVYEHFRRAMENRKVAETQCNEFSSRSHFIFQLNLNGVNTLAPVTDKPSKNNIINATLNLIDLAGSERLNLAKTEGERLKETQCINKSLTALSDVINAMAVKSAFVPYRNSKLTHMLQKYLEGSSKTLMLVNASPRLEDFNQTLQSLRFAEKVKSCKVGNQPPQQQQNQLTKKT